ncbi:MAG: chemoreceptor glutamine deamidase CheD [Rhodanobacter sp.]
MQVPLAARQLESALSPASAGFEHLQRFWDVEQACMAVKLLPGEFYVSTRGEMISTVLGSCVSACIHDIRGAIGGMNHFLLPEPLGERDGWSSTAGRAARYGSDAMEQLINAILKLGGRREDMRVKVFGGGCVMARLGDVGRRNIEFVQRYIATEKLVLLASDLGDVYPRQVQFFPQTGRVRVRLLRRSDDVKLVAAEHGYLKRLASDPIKGEVELF